MSSNLSDLNLLEQKCMKTGKISFKQPDFPPGCRDSKSKVLFAFIAVNRNSSNQIIHNLQSITTQQNPDSLRRRYLIQLINREQHFISAMNFGVERFVTQLKERKDLISTNDHRTLFQNIDELLQLSEDVLEQLLQNDHDPQIHFASRVYLSKSMAICAAYKKYCNGLKRADCVLVIESSLIFNLFTKIILLFFFYRVARHLGQQITNVQQ